MSPGQSAALFERLLQDLPDPVPAVRPDHSIAYAKPATETVCGSPPTLDNRAIQKIQRLREHIPRTTRVHRPDSPEEPD